MFKLVSQKLIRSHQLFLQSRATYVRGFWPEPITQQTLEEFLHDTNYFEQPDKFTNIGLDKSKTLERKKFKRKKPIDKPDTEKVKDDPNELEEVFNLLSHDTVLPTLNHVDTRLEGEQLVNLAIEHGIYRDLLNSYKPKTGFVNFTQEQAERLDRLVPHFWITDQPFARVDRHQKKPDPLSYFIPLIGISAKFIHRPETSLPDEEYAHTSYYGNIIPACEASEKPSITLDGKLISSKGSESFVDGSNYSNWKPGLIETVNFDEENSKFYSVALLNLDHLHKQSANLHWMIANIRPQNSCDAKYDEICDYLPIHGIQGFGYSRYVFITLQHDAILDPSLIRINDFSLAARKFDMNVFLDSHKSINMSPVGLSWFQTTWDSSSNAIFHNYMNIRAPIYEYVQAKPIHREKKAYPGKIPFNLLLDHERDKKQSNEQVLLERLGQVDPFDYKDQYVPPRVPPTVFEDKGLPTWMQPTMFKKKNKLGIWRGLRPASAILPLNNNADLDYPIRPVEPSKKNPPENPNQYDPGKRFKSHKDMPTSKPPNEHQAVFIQESHEVHLDQVMKLMKEFETKEK